jgi:hypothetical protein
MTKVEAFAEMLALYYAEIGKDDEAGPCYFEVGKPRLKYSIVTERPYGWNGTLCDKDTQFAYVEIGNDGWRFIEPDGRRREQSTIAA